MLLNYQPQDIQPTIVYASPTQRTLFAYTVEVLHCIHSVQHSNSIAREQNTALVLDANILYQAIQHLIDATPFTDTQLEHYFQLQQTLEDFHRVLHQNLQDTLEIHLPYAVDFMLLGLSEARYSSLSSERRNGLHQQYETLYWEFLQGYSTIQQFITGVKKLLVALPA
mgnify:FL=1